jgi:DNA-binding GntR family transcriptional regulator
VLDFDIEELRDLFEVRLHLESLAVRRAADRFTEANAAAAHAALARFDDTAAAGAVRGSMRAHTDFHFTLYDASACGWLVALIRPAWDRSERFRPALLTSKDGPQERHRAYDTALLEACAAHDPEAAATALHDHLALASIIFERELGGRSIFDGR